MRLWLQPICDFQFRGTRGWRVSPGIKGFTPWRFTASPAYLGPPSSSHHHTDGHQWYARGKAYLVLMNLVCSHGLLSWVPTSLQSENCLFCHFTGSNEECLDLGTWDMKNQVCLFLLLTLYCPSLQAPQKWELSHFFSFVTKQTLHWEGKTCPCEP